MYIELQINILIIYNYSAINIMFLLEVHDM